MGLELTKDQYQTLLELVFLGNWMIHTVPAPEAEPKYSELEELLFQKAPEHHLPHLIQGPGNPSDLFLDKVFPLIDRYDDQSFWERLVELLAQRDLAQKYSASAWSALSEEERFEKLEQLKDKYFRIFDQNGLNALTLAGPINR